MRKLIESTQEFKIVCDNVSCNYKVKNEAGIPDDSAEYLNVPCPQCGENLLTEEDYKNALKVMKFVNFMNKWFSWLTIFSKGKNKDKIKVKAHRGIHIIKS